MKASVTLLEPSTLARRTISLPPTFITSTHRVHGDVVVFGPTSSLTHLRFRASSSPISPNSKPFASLSMSSSLSLDSLVYLNSFLRSKPKDTVFAWNRAPRNVVNGGGGADVFGEKERVVTVVLLGWLGAKAKHLRRFVQWYNSQGIHAVTFVVQVTDVLWVDLGTRLEQRMSAFGSQLSSWVSGKENDGRERCLIFHTLSNTGLFTCGAILDSFQGRDDLKKKIKGIIIDSGGGGFLDPKVWAAGIAAAVFKKRHSLINGFKSEPSALKLQEKEPPKIEAMLLAALEKLMTFLLNLPDFERRLRRAIEPFSEHPPLCPQLYLYSTVDRVIPFETIELCMEKQRRKGIKVLSFNFGSSLHVDHYRTFPDIYSSELHKFLNECFCQC
ncbi:hypothetical protein SLA2020_514990 [Shorea laevis]